MAKRYIKELNNEELEKVFHANRKIQELVEDDIFDMEFGFIQEQLEELKSGLKDWKIGWEKCYLKVSCSDSFIKALEALERDTPIFISEDIPKLEEALEVLEEYNDTDASEDDFYDLVEEVDTLAQELADMVAKRMENTLQTCLDESNQIECFIEFYAHDRLSQECYIEDGSYVLKEDVTKTFN